MLQIQLIIHGTSATKSNYQIHLRREISTNSINIFGSIFVELEFKSDFKPSWVLAWPWVRAS